MEEAVRRILEAVVARVTGPMSMRFILQPAIAILLGIRDGRLDAKIHRPHFIWDLLFTPKDRKRAFRSALRALLTPIVVATLLDAVSQYLIFHRILPVVALVVGTLVMGLPYALARAGTNRLLTAWGARRQAASQRSLR